MRPLQQASKMDESNPPTGTAQEVSLEGGLGMVGNSCQVIPGAFVKIGPKRIPLGDYKQKRRRGCFLVLIVECLIRRDKFGPGGV